MDTYNRHRFSSLSSVPGSQPTDRATVVAPMLGGIAGALYAGLVTAVHFAAYGRLDRMPVFGVGSVLVGAVIGLLGRMAWTFANETGSERLSDEPERRPFSTQRKSVQPKEAQPCSAQEDRLSPHCS